jgi:hypothetical protein
MPGNPHGAIVLLGYPAHVRITMRVETENSIIIIPAALARLSILLKGQNYETGAGCQWIAGLANCCVLLSGDRPMLLPSGSIASRETFVIGTLSSS